ncbi:MAG TPA: PmoA family protein [Acidobacteriota bacterium]|nr:PmoA family protein [Acidobacteriota bacterium]
MTTAATGDTSGMVFASLLLALLVFASCTSQDARHGPEPFAFEEQSGGKLLLREGNAPVLVYNFGMQSAADAPADRVRSSYIHPLFDLKGNPLTDDFPEDHFHHRGLSWMWPNVWVGEEHYDLWHIQGLYQRFESWLTQEIGDSSATLGIRNSWMTDKGAVADETVWIRVFRSDEHGRAIDVSLTWEAIDETIRFRGADERSYGGLCLRLAPREDAQIFSSKGFMESDSDLVPLPWADQSGRLGSDGSVSGVSIFQAPDNPQFPAGWCLRYYGFLGVSWPGEEIYTLEPGQPLTLSFRIWVHRGNWKEGRVEEAFDAFVDQPVVDSPQP